MWRYLRFSSRVAGVGGEGPGINKSEERVIVPIVGPVKVGLVNIETVPGFVVGGSKYPRITPVGLQTLYGTVAQLTISVICIVTVAPDRLAAPKLGSTTLKSLGNPPPGTE
tara:strand:+ start:771 stop:1103 length:333 start_codon:yes stop_codon:yes gene_type:complete